MLPMSSIADTNAEAKEESKTEIHTMDQALTLAGIGRFQYIIVFVAGVSNICSVMENQCMAYVVPVAKCDLDISVGEQGFINAVSFMGVLFGSHFWGFLTDTWGRHRTLQLALFCMFIMSSISSLSLTSWMLIVTRFIVGVCSVGIRIATVAYTDEFLTVKKRSTYITFFSSFAAGGVTVLPLLGLSIMTMSFEYNPLPFLVLKPWRLFIFICSLITGLTAFSLIFLPEGPKYMQSQGNEAEALAVLRLVHRFNTGRSDEEYAVKKIASTDGNMASNLSDVKGVRSGFAMVWKQTTDLFKPPYLSSMVNLCLLIFLSFAVAQGVLLWFPQILAYYSGITTLPLTLCQAIAIGRSAELAGLNENLSNITSGIQVCASQSTPMVYYVNLIMGLTSIMLNIIAVILMEKVGKTILLSTRLLINALAAIGLIWASHFVLNIFCVILLLSTFALINILIAISGDQFPSHHKGMAIGYLLMAGQIGAIVGSNVVGAVLFDFCEWWLYVNAAILLGATVFCYFLLKKSESKGVAK